MTTAFPVPVFEIAPGETLNFGLNWEDWLGTGVTIASSSWEITPASAESPPEGVERVTDSIDSDTTGTTIKCSVGTAGILNRKYRATNTIVDSSGETGVQSIDFIVVDK